MDGTETTLEMERCAIWDFLWKHGGSTAGEISRGCAIPPAKVTKLVDHEWFVMQGGYHYIAMVDGVRRKGILVA